MSPSFDPAKYQRERRATVSARVRLGEYLSSKYGLSLPQYDQLLSRQDGGCAVCQKPPKAGQRLNVDHDHQTGVVRALLCGSCNTALGIMEENPEYLWKLLDYAEHCVSMREWYSGDPIRLAVIRAYKQSADLPQRRQLLLEAVQRLHNRPVAEVMSGRRGREVAKVLEELAARRLPPLEVASTRAGSGHEAVFV